MGIPGEFEHPNFKKALEKVLEVSKKMGALMGTHIVKPDSNVVKEKIEEGYRFVAFSTDTLFLGQSCRDGLAEIGHRTSE